MNNDNFWNDERVKSAIAELAKRFAYPNEHSDKWEGIDKEIEKWKASNTSSNEEVGWEIECVVHGNRNYWRQNDGFYRNGIFETGTTSDWLLKNNGTIFQVTRKSDGVVFSVGDEILFRMLGGMFSANIDRFEIDTFDEKEITAYYGAFGIGYNRWKKVTLEPTDYTGLKRDLITASTRMDHLEERIAYIEKKLNIEG